MINNFAKLSEGVEKYDIIISENLLFLPFLGDCGTKITSISSKIRNMFHCDTVIKLGSFFAAFIVHNIM